MKNLTLPALAATLLLAGSAGRAAAATPESWVGTWGAAMSNPDNDVFFAGTAYLGTNAFNNQTMRLIVHVSLGGRKIRVRLTNEQGTTPVTVGAAHVALSTAGGGIEAGSDRVLTFGGAPAVTLPPGAPAVSDPVALAVTNGANLAVSLYLPGAITVTCAREYAVQTGFVAAPGSGDTTGAAALPLDPTQPYINEWPLLGGIEVKAPGAGTVVAFGASITGGFDTTMDANMRWPDLLAKRLYKHGQSVAVVNPSITGNHLITDQEGQNALARFDRDVLARPGVRFVIVADTPGLEISAGAGTTADGIIAALKQLISRAHSRHVKIIGATATPNDGFITYSPANEAERQAVNAFIRTTTLFDGVVDFDAALRDPSQPSFLDAAYDSGDHHHPNDAGQARMAGAIPLTLFE